MSYVRLLFYYCIYHVYNRGNNRENIFPTDRDKEVFLIQIAKIQKEYNFVLYAYCIMDNHYHLVLKDVGKNLPIIIGLIQENYAIYYNAKYKRSGQVFENPFKSNPVLDNSYLFTLLCYVANNPVSAGIIDKYFRYQWSSRYLNGFDIYNLVDYTYVKYLCIKYNDISIHSYILQHKSKGMKSILELRKLNDGCARIIFNLVLSSIIGEKEYDKNEIGNEKLIEIIKEATYEGLSIRQIVKFTGVPHNFVRKHKQPDKPYII